MESLPPQPPPNALPPPPCEAALRAERWWWWIFGVGMVSVFVVASLASPMLFRKRGPTALHLATMHARQIGLALIEFESEFGSYPDATTAKMVEDATGIPRGLAAVSSNDVFRQIMAADMVAAETIFFVRTDGSSRPDNVTTGSRLLEKGEVSFSYVAGLSTNGDPRAPQVLFPLVPGKRLFDYATAKRFTNGKAIILRVDNSVIILPVDKSGKVFVDGKDLFDPALPFWGGKLPDVKWPE